MTGTTRPTLLHPECVGRLSGCLRKRIRCAFPRISSGIHFRSELVPRKRASVYRAGQLSDGLDLAGNRFRRDEKAIDLLRGVTSLNMIARRDSTPPITDVYQLTYLRGFNGLFRPVRWQIRCVLER